MARTHLPVSSGIIVLQPYESGKNPPSPAETIYTAGKWMFNPGVVQEYVKGPRGVDMIAVATGITEQTLTVDFMEAPLRAEANRLMGNVTYLAANTSAAVRYVASFQYNGGLKSKADLRSAVNALTLAINAESGLYQITLVGAATPVLQRISPIPETIATHTTVLGAALTATTFVPASPPASSGGTVIFAVNSAIDGGFLVDWDSPQTPLHNISCFSDFELGNAFSYLHAGSCVPAEPSLEMERGALSNKSQTYRIMGADVEVGQFNYNRGLSGPPGIV